MESSEQSTTSVTDQNGEHKSPVSAPQPVAPPSASVKENPGETLAIISFIVTLLGLSLIGAILGFLSRKKSKEAGYATKLGTSAMWTGIVITVLVILGLIIGAVFAAAGLSSLDTTRDFRFERDTPSTQQSL